MGSVVLAARVATGPIFNFMRLFIYTILLLQIFCANAFAQKTTAQLLAEVPINIPSGNPSVLTAASLRALLNDMINSSVTGATTSNTPVIGNVPIALSGTTAAWGQLNSIGGVTFSGTPAVGNVPVATSSTAAAWGLLPVTGGGTGLSTLTANAPLLGNGTGNVVFGTRSGNTTAFATSTGVLTNGHCVSIDANGNFIDAGGACTVGGGGGTVNAGTAGQMAYYATSTNAVSGNGNANISNGTLTLGTANTTLGSLIMEGSTSGALTITPQATAGTPTWTAGTSSGTPVVTASAPLAIASSTGNITVTGAAGTVLGGSTPAFTATPVLGTNGSTQGTLTLNGSTSGSLTITTPAAANTPTWTSGSNSGTPAVTASAPLALATATGNLSCSSTTGCTLYAIDAKAAGYVKCDGSTNDTTGINNALTAAGSGGVILPSGTCIVTTGSIVINTNGQYLMGQGYGATILRTANGTGNVITMGSSSNTCTNVSNGTSAFGMGLFNLTINASVSRTGGAAVYKYATQKSNLSGLDIQNMFDGVTWDGNCSGGANGDYDTYLTNSIIGNNSDYGIQIGTTTCTATTQLPQNVFLQNLDVSGNNVGLKVLCAGGLNTTKVQGITNTTGASYQPSTNQFVSFFSTDDQWDTSSGPGVQLSPTGGIVTGEFNGLWASSSTGVNGIGIAVNYASGTVRSVRFTNCYVVNNAQQGIWLNTGSRLSFDNCNASMNSTSGLNNHSGMEVSANISHLVVSGGFYGNAHIYGSGATTNNQKYGIDIPSASDSIIIQGTDTTGNNTNGSNCTVNGINCNAGITNKVIGNNL